MIQELLPGACAAVEFRGSQVSAVPLPAEEALVATAVPARRQEFAAGRACARAALARFGVVAGAIGRDECGAPKWPDGMVGSITHCVGYQAAAVARREHIAALGIDAEPHEGLPDGVLPLITSAAESAHIAGLRRNHPDLAWDRVLFSAKESVYKCWCSIMKSWLDFSDTDLTFAPASGRFTVQLLRDPLVLPGRRVDTLHGRWALADGLILTAVALPMVCSP